MFFLFFFSLSSIAHPIEEGVEGLVVRLKTSPETASRKAKIMVDHFVTSYLQEEGGQHQKAFLESLTMYESASQRYDFDDRADCDLLAPLSPTKLKAGVEEELSFRKPMMDKAAAEITANWLQCHKDEFYRLSIPQLICEAVSEVLWGGKPKLRRYDSGYCE